MTFDLGGNAPAPAAFVFNGSTTGLYWGQSDLTGNYPLSASQPVLGNHVFMELNYHTQAVGYLTAGSAKIPAFFTDTGLGRVMQLNIVLDETNYDLTFKIYKIGS